MKEQQRTENRKREEHAILENKNKKNEQQSLLIEEQNKNNESNIPFLKNIKQSWKLSEGTR